MQENIILSNIEIQNKIKRISYQIYETFVDEDEIILAGIAENGYLLTEKIAEQLEKISPIKTVLAKIIINKTNVLENISCNLLQAQYQNKCIVVIDDVLNSGSTLIYGVKHFLEVPVKKIKTVVLIDRNHKNFPIKADFKGLSLSTSSHEHVEVIFEGNTIIAKLS